MKVEVLYFKGCPNHPVAVARAFEALRSLGQSEQVREREIASRAEAEDLHFLGSPSVRVNGLDVEPQAREAKTYGLGCRVYAENGIQNGAPSVGLIRRALLEQMEPANRAPRHRMFIAGTILFLMLTGRSFSTEKRSTPASFDKTSSTAKPELTKKVLESLQNIEGKTVAIAEDFPDDFYNTYRPKGNQDVRTAAEILLHVAGVNTRMGFLLSTKQQKDAVFAAGKVPAVRNFPYVSKTDTVMKVKASFEAVRKAIQDNPDLENLDGWIYVIAHSSEHFGNLVTYYRVNGLVPPTSRQ